MTQTIRITEQRAKKLNEVFQRVGKDYGYETCEATFEAFTDFKVRWQRSYHWIDLHVSDYLADAPEDVLEGLAVSLFRRITGEEDAPYSEKLKDWITRPEFAPSKREVYLHRRNYDDESSEILAAGYRRLVDAGLLPYDENVRLCWNHDRYNHKAGSCSVLMKVVSISDWFEDAPDNVVDYVLFRYIAHITLGYDPDRTDDGYDRMVAGYPDKEDCEDYLRNKEMYI